MKKMTAVTIATSLGTSPSISAIDAIENNIEKVGYDVENGFKNPNDDTTNKTFDASNLVESLSSLEGVVTSETLNVRSAADTTNAPVGKLVKGDIVTIISQEDNGWYKINYDGNIAYVSNDYIDVKDNVEPDYMARSTNKTGEVVGLSKGDTLNVRSLPNTKGKILYKLNAGSQVKITGEESNGWYRIEYNSKEGFVSGKYIKIISSNEAVNTRKGKVVNLKGNDTLNVRAKNSTSSKVLYTLKNKTEVEILDKTSNGWFKISYNGTVGFASGKYIEEIKEVKPDTQLPSTNTTKYEVTVDVNLRKTNSWSGAIVKVARKGEILNVISIDQDWAKVDLNGTEVYAPSRYLSKVDNSNEEPETEKPETKKYIVTSDANLRDSNSWGGNIVYVVKKGEPIDVISIEGDWAKVYYNDKVLYAPSSYLVEEDKYVEETPEVPETPTTPDTPVVPDAPVVPETPSEPEVETPQEKPTTVKYITTADVNMRETASWSGIKIKVIKSGEVVEVVEVGENWTKIYDNNKYGYIPSQYIVPQDLSIQPEAPEEESENVKYTIYNFTLSDYIKEQKDANPVSYTEEKLREYINPTNCHKYEFLELDKFREINVSKLNNLLAKNNAGVLMNQGQAIYDAAKRYNIDPLYFIAQSIHETGYGKSTLAKGVRITEIADESKPIKDSKGNITGYEMIQLDEPVTVYNLYGIGAKDNLSTMPNRALILGTTHAYNQGWTSVEKAIAGAAQFVSNNYINSTKYDQNTLYKIRFNPSKTYLWHQYATTPWYAREIAKLMDKFDSAYEENVSFTYDKPKFNDSRIIELLSVKNPIEDEGFIDVDGKEDIVYKMPY